MASELQQAVEVLKVEIQKLEGQANVDLAGVKQAFAEVKTHVENEVHQLEHDVTGQAQPNQPQPANQPASPPGEVPGAVQATQAGAPPPGGAAAPNPEAQSQGQGPVPPQADSADQVGSENSANE